VSVNSVNIVHSVNKVVNPHKDNYHYVGGGGPTEWLMKLAGIANSKNGGNKQKTSKFQGRGFQCSAHP
jgi:hypothetical protein